MKPLRAFDFGWNVFPIDMNALMGKRENIPMGAEYNKPQIKNITFKRLKVFVVLIFGSIFSLFSQSTEEIILEFHQYEEYQMMFPCIVNIDTIYNKQDTLFIEIFDDRIFHLDSNWKRLLITGNFYYIKAKKFKRLLAIPATKQEYHFIGLQMYDNVYIFKKYKKGYALSNIRIFKNYPYIYVMEPAYPRSECPANKSKRISRLIMP